MSLNLDEVVCQLQKEALEDLNSLYEKDNLKNIKVIKESKRKLYSIFEEMNRSIHQLNEDQTKLMVIKSKQELIRILYETKETTMLLSENDAFDNHKEFLSNTSRYIQYGYITK